MVLDRKGPNRSFKDMRILLQTLGIKNNQFMLNTNRRELNDFNYDDNGNLMPSVGVIELDALREESRENLWFYFRRILRIPTTYGNIPNLFELTPIALEILWLYEKGFSIFINNSGDRGVTTILASLITLSRFLGEKTTNNSNEYNTEPIITNNISLNSEGFKRKVEAIKENQLETYARIIEGYLPLSLFYHGSEPDIQPSHSIYSLSIDNSVIDDIYRVVDILTEKPNIQTIISSTHISSKYNMNKLIESITMKFDTSWFDKPEYEIEEMSRSRKYVYINLDTDELSNYSVSPKII